MEHCSFMSILAHIYRFWISFLLLLLIFLILLIVSFLFPFLNNVPRGTFIFVYFFINLFLFLCCFTFYFILFLIVPRGTIFVFSFYFYKIKVYCSTWNIYIFDCLIFYSRFLFHVEQFFMVFI